MAMCMEIDPTTSLYCSLPKDHDESEHVAINFYECRVLARWPRAHTSDPRPQSDPEWAICPYCGAKWGDTWEWVEERPKNETCGKCGKAFVVWAEYSVIYRTVPTP